MKQDITTGLIYSMYRAHSYNAKHRARAPYVLYLHELVGKYTITLQVTTQGVNVTGGVAARNGKYSVNNGYHWLYTKEELQCTIDQSEPLQWLPNLQKTPIESLGSIRDNVDQDTIDAVVHSLGMSALLSRNISPSAPILRYFKAFLKLSNKPNPFNDMHEFTTNFLHRFKEANDVVTLTGKPPFLTVRCQNKSCIKIVNSTTYMSIIDNAREIVELPTQHVVAHDKNWELLLND